MGTFRQFLIPLGGKDITLEGEFPVTAVQWQQFMAILNAMRPGLVQQEENVVRDSSRTE